MEVDVESGWLDRIPVAVMVHDVSGLLDRLGDAGQDRSPFDVRVELEKQPELLRELMAIVRIVEVNAQDEGAMMQLRIGKG